MIKLVWTKLGAFDLKQAIIDGNILFNTAIKFENENCSQDICYQGQSNQLLGRLQTEQMLIDGNIRLGYGRIIYTNGDYYVGQIKDNKPNGIGTKTSAEGVIQKGKWENGFYKK